MRLPAALQNVLFCAFATNCQLTIEAAHIGGSRQRYQRCGAVGRRGGSRDG
jgi:hypothetical protein